MTTFVWREVAGVKQLVEKGGEFDVPPDLQCADLRPQVIRDAMDPTVHMATGRVFESKRAFRAETKAAGCVEVGDQKNYGLKRKDAPKLDRRQRVDDIKRSIYDLRNGRRG